MTGKRIHYLSMIAVAVVATVGVVVLMITAPEAQLRGRLLVVAGAWWRFVAAFVLVAGGIGAIAYLYGLATRPLRALRYAFTMATHVFLWVVIALIFYPVVYLLAVSFNRNDTLAGALPRIGSLLVRSGVLPNPADFSLVQYGKVLSQTHLHSYQWLLIILFGVAIVTVLATMLAPRFGAYGYRWQRLRSAAGWAIFAFAAVLIFSIQPSQFYGVLESGRKLPASVGGMVPLYIRNTLLVSGTTGILAVLLSTTAGYAFSCASKVVTARC